LEGSVTVIVPAYNEQDNIQSALGSVRRALRGVDDWEIIVIDDGSRDRTGEIARQEAKKEPRIRVLVHAVNSGFGTVFKTGLRQAAKEYLTIFPGDDDMSGDSLRDIISLRGQADLIISYVGGGHTRSLFRRTVSGTYVLILNLLFGLRLRYYNGPFIYKTSLVRDITIRSTGMSVLSECLVRLIRRGYSYKAIPIVHTGRRASESKALSVKSLIAVARAIAALARDIYFPPRKTAGDKA
jgi:dolichol-phosphate mannosyltransferase